MPSKKTKKPEPPSRRALPFGSVALLLQGGGALGAYQAGVYEALAEADLHPDWVAGISIGAINSAIIAGNSPEQRIDKLRQFWEGLTANSLGTSVGQFRDAAKNYPLFALFDQTGSAAAAAGAEASEFMFSHWPGAYTQKLHEFWERMAKKPFEHLLCEMESFVVKGDISRGVINQMSAAYTLLNGVPGFFSPRVPGPWLLPTGSLDATSYCDPSPLKSTLEQLIDFDRINAGETRLSVEAVNVRSGNYVYFDSTSEKIRVEHIMASGALPPGFPAVEIDGEYYWDGGLVSNTPLQLIMDSTPRHDTLAFQVDLWSARGGLPRNMTDVMTRQKEIQYSSRTRASTDRFKEAQKARHAFSTLYNQLPENLKKSPEAKMLHDVSDHKAYNIVHLIYRAKNYEGDSKDYEFSRLSMQDHWRAGYDDTVRALRHKEIFQRPKSSEGVAIFDFVRG
ncbi:MAG: patatin-like phospholipase family protein [Alphaproteobacteria bacterium]